MEMEKEKEKEKEKEMEMEKEKEKEKPWVFLNFELKVFYENIQLFNKISQNITSFKGIFWKQTVLNERYSYTFT